MANVTFSSPAMPRDITVYAVAGDRGNLLALAKAHNIPIPFDCQDGECGSCLVEIKHLNAGARYGIALTEKEKEQLKQLGKITKEEIMDAEVNDMPPRFRLACQCFVRNEDIFVSFEGDTTLPVKGPTLSIAAAVYKGGVQIKTLDEFLSYAVKAALQGERRGFEYYYAIAGTTKDAEIRAVAKAFVREETEHVEKLKQWIAQEEAALRATAGA